MTEELVEFVPASDLPKVRQVDTIARSILKTMDLVLEEGPKGLSLELAKEIAISAHIDARYRGVTLEALDTGASLPVASAKAQGPPPGQWDIFSQEETTENQVKLFNFCVDKVEDYLVKIGTPMAEATKGVHKFLEDMFVGQYNKPYPRTQKDLKRGPMSYLIDMMKEHYPKAIPPKKE